MAIGTFDENDRFKSRMFESNNRITFKVAVDDLTAAWWVSEFYEPFKLTPEGVGDKLSASWTGEKRMTVTELDGVSKRFSIEVSGQFDMVNFWIHDRTLDMDGRVMNANRMFIAEDRQRSGFGRAFMQDAASLCDTVGIRKIRLEADGLGRYAWLRCGFVPDQGSWFNLQEGILRRLAMASTELDPARFMEVLKYAKSPDPQNARLIASLRDVVMSNIRTPDGPRPTTLGRALILEQQHNWVGEINLDDDQSRNMLYEGD